MRYREVAKKLKALGCYEIVNTKRKRGSHRKWFNPATNGLASIPDHGRRDLKIGTLHAVLRYLGIDWQDFNDA